jgi:aerobic carbon-monoxide dehydrogenase medium subunit
MKPAPFDYSAPRSLDQALEALRKNAPEAKVLAGGQSLMPLLNLRLARPKVLIDLNGVPGLDEIRETANGIEIDAMARQSRVERASLVREKCPVLAEAIRHIGHVAVRHRGTVGGSLVHADPTAELPALALALEARFEIAKADANRVLSAEQFYVDYLTTAVEPDEILRRITFPILRASAGYAVEEIARRHGDFAVAGVIAIVDLDHNGKIAEAHIALFGVAPMPVRARAAERSLMGQEPNENALRDAAVLLEEVLDPPDDVRASSAYRKHAAAVLTARALARAVERGRARRSS